MKGRNLAVCVAALSVLFLPACGGGGDSGPTPTPPAPTPTPGPSQATITVTTDPMSLVTPPGAHAFAMQIPFSITESAGLGANWNYARLMLFVGGVEVERQEIGSNAIISQTGNNRIEANATRSGTLTFGFNRGDATLVRLELGFGDDRGNTLTATVQVFP
jgi:hypothetical protein